MTRQVGGNQHNPQRRSWDDYPTDPLWVKALCDRVELRGRVWEPACGDGHMVRALADAGYDDVRATDIVRTGDDFLINDESEWAGSIVTNPPFRFLDAFIDRARELATEQVAMLMAIGALGGKKRSEALWHATPPALVLVVPRYMNVIDRSSQFYHIWCVWDRSYDGPTEIDWAPMPPEYKRLRHPSEIGAGYQPGRRKGK